MLKNALLLILFFPLSTAYGQQGNNNLSPDEAMRRLIEASRPIYQQARDWVCTAETRQICRDGTCTKVSSNQPLTITLSFPLVERSRMGSYTRCLGDCSTTTGNAYLSGMYTHVYFAGTFIKIENDTKKFVDVATLRLDTFVSFGTCVARAN
jgi:hypothetical protein